MLFKDPWHYKDVVYDEEHCWLIFYTINADTIPPFCYFLKMLISPVSHSHQFVVFVQFAVLEHVAEDSRGGSGSF